MLRFNKSIKRKTAKRYPLEHIIDSFAGNDCSVNVISSSSAVVLQSHAYYRMLIDGWFRFDIVKLHSPPQAMSTP